MADVDYNKLPPECDKLCKYRKCLHKGEDKGSYTVGRGYTSYYDKPRYVCVTRMLRGCPDGILDGRPLPPFERIEAQIELEIGEAKATQKVKRQLMEYLQIIKTYHKVLEKTQKE